MAKRPTVDVDEDYLKEIMAGGVVSLRKEQMKPVAEQSKLEVEETPAKEEDTETSSAAETKEPVKQVRKKREAPDYESIFLERKAGEERQQIYISSRLYKKITEFLPLIGGYGFGITAFVNNILAHHLEQYTDDINELYARKTQKPL